MSHFYGYLQGSRGQATRCGTKSSGISAHIRSWNNDVKASLYADDKGEDVLNLDVPEGLLFRLGRASYILKDGKLQFRGNR